jgi:hypothetical protein
LRGSGELAAIFTIKILCGAPYENQPQIENALRVISRKFEWACRFIVSQITKNFAPRSECGKSRPQGTTALK